MLLREFFFLSFFFENAKLGFIESGDDSAQAASKLLSLNIAKGIIDPNIDPNAE